MYMLLHVFIDIYFWLFKRFQLFLDFGIYKFGETSKFKKIRIILRQPDFLKVINSGNTNKPLKKLCQAMCKKPNKNIEVL